MSSQSSFGSLTPDLIARLVRFVGNTNVLIKDGKEDYSRDEAPHPHPVMPDIVLKPETPEAIAEILKLSSQYRIPVTPRGTGTGLSGGAIPVYGGISLSLEKLNRVLDLDEANFSVTAEAGVILAELCKTVESHGLYYPLYPGETSSSIGGNIATNAGGMRAVKYGVTRNFVLGLEAVLPNGEIIQTGGKYFKSSTAYDLTQLITGSEGTLAVITKVTLRLIAPPGSSILLFIPFKQLEDAIKSVPAILKEKILPVGMEFMEQDILKLVESYAGIKVPLPGYPAYLLIFLESSTQDEFMAVAEKIGEICMQNGAVDIFLPNTDEAKRNLMEVREKFYPTLQHNGMLDIADTVVPRSRIAEFVIKVKDIGQKYNILVVAYGHAGDGNVHVHPIGPVTTDSDKVKALMQDVYKAGVAMGGTISGEHGLGRDKKDYLPLAASPGKIELYKAIKKAFDPQGILNPGKVFNA